MSVSWWVGKDREEFGAEVKARFTGAAVPSRSPLPFDVKSDDRPFEPRKSSDLNKRLSGADWDLVDYLLAHE